MFCRIGGRRGRTRHGTTYFVGRPVDRPDPWGKYLEAPAIGNRTPSVNKSERQRRIDPKTTLYLWNAQKQTTDEDQSQSDIKTTWFHGSPGTRHQRHSSRRGRSRGALSASADIQETGTNSKPRGAVLHAAPQKTARSPRKTSCQVPRAVLDTNNTHEAVATQSRKFGHSMAGSQ